MLETQLCHMLQNIIYALIETDDLQNIAELDLDVTAL